MAGLVSGGMYVASSAGSRVDGIGELLGNQ